MIWSTNTRDLRKHHAMLASAKPPMLESTGLLAPAFADRGIPYEPVSYLEIQPQAHKIGKMVIPYASIDAQGRLSQNIPYFYAVTARPDTLRTERTAATTRSQQAHVVAEDLSLKRGLFTPFARVNTEVLLSGMLAPGYVDGYLKDRIAHLETMSGEAEKTELLYPTQRDFLVEEFSLAIEALQNRID